jgi:myo-inositol-1(or 4)-monophosphatase
MKASKSMIRDFGEIEKLQISAKGPGDFVTNADKRSEKIIIEELLKAHPDYGILSEETGEINKNNKEKRWIIDPIDGTMNFLKGVPHFAISIAYEENGEVVCGLVFDPIKDELFIAEKGNGAFLNNSRIRVTNKSKIFDEYVKVSNIVNAPVRKFGCASLDLAYVACGRFDGSWQWELSYWDIAASIIIVKEAGGYVDFLDLQAKGSVKRNVIATNSAIHDELKNNLLKKIIE